MPAPRCLPHVMLITLVAACGGTDAQDTMPREPGILTLVDSFRVAPGDADLTRVGFMTISPDGDIVVGQPEDGYLKVFGDDGENRTVGRSGEGPGEFTNVTRLGWIGDTLWALDPGLKRISRFDRGYTFLGATPEPIEITTRAADRDTSEAGSMVFVQAVLPDGGLRVSAPFSATHPPAWAAGLDSGSAPFFRIDGDGVIQQRLAVEPPDPCTVRYAIGATGVGNTRVPFCSRWIDTGWDGGERLGIVEITPPEAGGPSYRVTAIGATGDTAFSRTFSYDPIAVTQRAIDSLRERIDKAYASMPPAMRDAVPHPEPAATFPPIRRIVLGRDDTVWLEEWSDQPGHHWLMLSPGGDPVGRLVLPGNVRLMTAEQGTIWGTEEDADGLLGIVRYTVR